MASIFKRKDTGKWEIAYKDAEGRRRRNAIYKTKPEALKALAEITKDIEEGTYLEVNKKLTFKEASNKYITQYTEIHCKPSTVKNNKGYLKNHILPVFGERILVSIKKPEIEDFIIHLKSKSLSPQMINHIIFLTGAIFEKMIDDGYIKINPVRKIKKLKISGSKADFLTPEEVHKCLETAKVHYSKKLYILLYTAIFSGLRQGELFALTWNDIDFDKRVITINKSFSKGQLSTTKTKSSIRNVRICPSLFEQLLQWKDERIENNLNLVFSNDEGNYLDSRNIMRRFFHPCLKKAGLRIIRWHDLRHTHISLLLNGGVAPQVAQHQAGHSTSKTTMDVYGHIMPSVYDASIDSLDAILQKPKLRVVS